MRPQSRNCDMDDTTEAGQLEELVRLRRSYRVMQNDYRAYKEQTKRSLNKQNPLVQELEKERMEIDTMLKNMESTQNKGKDETHARKLSELSSMEEDNQMMIEEERRASIDLDAQILAMERSIAEQRKKMGGVHNSTNKRIAIEKWRAILQNRLDKSVVYFNRQLAINSKLREDIDHCRGERGVFEGLYKRLAKEMDQTKAEIAEVIRLSTQAFEQRDEAKGKMNALRERNEKDQKQHDSEMKELDRIISHDNNMKEFMQLKSNDRADYKSEESAKKKRNERSMDTDQIFMQSYEQAFGHIKEVTQLNDVGEIVENFVTNEEENFALFNYVNELNCEIETLQEELSQVTEHIKAFKEQDQEFTKRHTSLMADLEDKYAAVSKDSTKTESSLKVVNKALDHLRHGLEKLFALLDCDQAPLQAMLGCDSGISNKNVMIYLGQIEQKVTQILHVQQYVQQKKEELEGIVKSRADTKAQPASTASFSVVPPTLEEFDSGLEADEEAKPLSQAKLRERVVRDLERGIVTDVHKEHLNKIKDLSRPKDGKKKK